jgi:hypothetical protein
MLRYATFKEENLVLPAACRPKQASYARHLIAGKAAE